MSIMADGTGIEQHILAAVRLAPASPGESLMGFGVGAALVLISPLLGNSVHGGDLKLLAAVGATLGLTATSTALILSLVFALVYSLANLLVRGRLNSALRVAA